MKQTQGNALFVAPTIGDVQFQTTDDSWWYCKADGVWTYVASPGMAFLKPDSIEVGDYYGTLAGGRSIKIAPEGTSAFARFFIQQTIGGNPQPAAIADPNAVLELNSNSNATNFWFSVPEFADGGTNATFGFTTDGAFRHALTYVCQDNRFSLTPDGIQASPTRGLSISGDGWLSVNKKIPDAGSMLHMYDSVNFAARGMTMDLQCPTAGNVFLKMRCGNTLSGETHFSLSESGTLTHTNSGNIRWSVSGGTGAAVLHANDYGDGNETRFGVGTTSPQANLHINADLPTTRTFALIENGTGSGSAGLRLSDDTGQFDIDVTPTETVMDVDFDGEGNPFYIRQNTQTKLAVGSNGFVGIGVVVPDRRFHVVENGPFVMRLRNSLSGIDSQIDLLANSPISGGGHPAPITSLALEDSTPGVWFKWGPLNLNWARLLTTADAALMARKTGTVGVGSFVGGPPLTATVTFATAYPAPAYSVQLTAVTSTGTTTTFALTVDTKTSAGFVISLNSAASANLLAVDWTATPYGEVP